MYRLLPQHAGQFNTVYAQCIFCVSIAYANQNEKDHGALKRVTRD